MFYATPYENFDKDGQITGRLYVNEDSTLFLFQYAGKYCISETPSLKVNSGYTTNYKTLNGKNYWTRGSNYLWYDSDESTYKYGTILGRYGTKVELRYDAFTGWQSDSLIGTYNPAGGQSGEPIRITKQDKDNILIFLPNIFYE
jgi:hypothetical protein